MNDFSSFVKIAKKTGIEFIENYPLGKKCSYGTGGNASCAYFPDDADKTAALVKELKEAEAEFIFLGAGSNILVSDDGYSGAVISTEKLKGITSKAEIVTAYAGERLENLVKYALYNSLGGIEFLSGIPASVGGAVAMNAGCFGKTVGDYVLKVYSTDGEYNNADCGFNYRESVFKGDKGVIAVSFALDVVEFEQSESKIEYFKNLRKNKQPKGRSCGSVFKNDGYFAGRLIENAGLKGVKRGGARVSEKHANFIIAEAGATSEDVYSLIRFVKKRVEETTGTILKEEVRYVGNFK